MGLAFGFDVLGIRVLSPSSESWGWDRAYDFNVSIFVVCH